MNYRLIPMTAEHVPQVAALERTCFSHPWTEDMLRQELWNDAAVIVVAEGEDGTVLGYAGLQAVLDEGYNFAESLVCAVGAGVGFMVAMVLFSGVRKRLEDAQPPKCFEGLPITLVAASVTSLSFMGFGGVIENIFAGH